MLFYDKEEKIQVRLKVECTVNHENEVTKESWSKTQHISRKCYLVDNGPRTGKCPSWIYFFTKQIHFKRK